MFIRSFRFGAFLLEVDGSIDTCTSRTGLIEKMKSKAATRNLKELTIGPVITQTTEQMLGHVQNLYV